MYGCVRYVYNRTLGDNGREYEAWKGNGSEPGRGPKCDYYTFANRLPGLKMEKDFLKVAPSHTLQATVKNLSDAFSGFFNGDSKHPKFKKRKNGGSLTFPDGVTVDTAAATIRLPKFPEGIPAVVHDTP